MSLKKEAASGVAVYNLSAGKTLPEWLREKKKTALRYDEDYKKRIELIQHLEFPVASQTVRMSPDGTHLLATGVHSPRLNVYDLKELTLKFERFLTCECVKMSPLGDDWKKVALLHADRTVEFHAQYGSHFKIRVPKPGRDMAYLKPTAELLVGGASPEIFRLNLEQGQFFAPIQTSLPEINSLALAPTHNLIAVGGSDGVLQCFDPRDRKCVGQVDVGAAANAEVYGGADGAEVTALNFKADGLVVGAGLSTGQCLLFDLRSSRPLQYKDHQYGERITSLHFHDQTRNIISTDTKIVKVWDQNSGKMFTSVEPSADINDMIMVPGTGMMIMAVEEPRMQVYYIPELGVAPKWCAFLDSLTEELEEEDTPDVYDDYKFVTRGELQDLGLDSLVGSSMMRPYMHGFFIDAKLYHRAKAVVTPFDPSEYRKKQVRDKLAKESTNRITIEKKLPKVNANLAAKLLEFEAKKKETGEKEKLHHIDSDHEDDDAAPKTAIDKAGLLQDSRFSKMFTSEDFEINEESEVFRHLHPAAASARDKNTKAKRDRERIEEHFDKLDESDEEEDKPAMYAGREGHEMDGTQLAPSKRQKSASKKSLQERIAGLEKRGKNVGNRPLAEASTFHIPTPSGGKGKGKGKSKGKGSSKGGKGKGKSKGKSK